MAAGLDMKMNTIKSAIVVLGALAFGYLSIQIGFKPFPEKAQQQQQALQQSDPSTTSHEWISKKNGFVRMKTEIRERNAITERVQADIYSAEELFTELNNIGFVMAGGEKVRAFFGCPVKEGKNFLIQFMHAPPGFIPYSFHG